MALQYDPLDPFGLKARQPQITPLQPVEEQSILSKIGGKALGGLGWVGDFLDKYTGGRAVRGLLGGKPEELASILPFSDQLGLSDEKNRVTGRDLTDQWGLSSAGSDSGWDTAKGIGADVLTNPFTYLMPFGLTKAGESASKIGILPSSTRARIAGLKLPNWTPEVAQKAAEVGIPAAEVLNQPLGGLARFHIPFTDISANLGTGAGGTAVLDTLNAVGNLPGISGALGFAGRVTAPVGRHLNALFNAKVKGATSEAGKAAGRGYTSAVEQGMNDIRAWEGQQIDTLGKAGVLDKGGELRAVMENPYPSSPIGVQGQAYHDVTGATSDIHNALDQAGAAKGFAPHQLQDTEAAYASRHMLEPDIGTRGYGGRRQALPIKQAALEPREDFLKNIPGGTETINRLTVDPEFSGIAGRFGPGQAPTTPLQRAEMIRGKYLGVSPAEEAQMGGALQKTKAWEGMTPADRQLNPHLQPTADEIALASKHEQSQALENWAAVNMDPKRLPSAANPQGIPFFGNHPLMDAEKTLVAKLQRNQAGEAVHNLLADTAVDAANAGPGYVPINKALTDVGFDDIGAAQNYLMGKIGGKFGQTPVTQLYVPPDALKDANRFLNGFTTPEALKPILGAVDYITNLTKAFTSGLWPATAGKYVSQALWTNAVHGFTDPAHALLSPLAHAMPYVNAQKLLRAGTIEGAAEIPFLKNMAAARGVAMTDAEATQEIAKLSHQYGATGAGGRGIGDVTGGAQAETLRSVIPGLDPIEGILGPRASEFFPHSLTEANPLNVAGAGSRKDLFSPVNYWRESARTVDETGRLSGFISRLQQGFHPQDAAQQVRAAYLDYGALSDFEKNVMKRFIPFYSYSRAIIPKVLSEIAENPGGLTGQAAMASGALRADKNQFVPEYLGAGAAIPLGKEDNGTQRFLGHLGLPVEAAFEALKPSLSQSMLGVLGQANPLIKAPLEYATGKQFMSGRDLADLYPLTGNTLIDQGVMNSPLSRTYTVGRTLADERKGIGAKALNLLTGARITDVDMDKQRSILERETLADALRGQQGVGRYETFYPRPDEISKLTPEQIMMLRLQKTLDERAKQKGKEQRVGVGG